MATPRQIEANRRNAQKSTGPKTPEGKQAVSLNSLRHGLRARTVVLPSENPAEYLQLCDRLEAEWEPLTGTEQFYLEQMAIAHWKLRRMELHEVRISGEKYCHSTKLPLLDRLWQAQCRLERSFARAQHELERIQIARQAPQPQPHESELAPAVEPVPAVRVAAAPPQEEEPAAVLCPPSSVLSSPATLQLQGP